MKREKLTQNTPRKYLKAGSFLGTDFTDSYNSEPSRAVYSVNMIRGDKGSVTKRHGYKSDTKYPDTVYGVHFYSKGDECKRLVHSGEYLYSGDEIIYSQMNTADSTSVQSGDKLYILDGEHFLVYDDEGVHSRMDNPYIPLVYKNRKPDGGGTRFEQPNLFTDTVTEGFTADGSSTQYVLSVQGLSSDNVTATVYRDDGTQYTVTNGNGITVNAVRGIVTFRQAPALSRGTDRDNVYITYTKNQGTDNSVLNKCTVMTLFGKGGCEDTLFLSGNEYYPGRVWYSAPDNPSFFGVENTFSAGGSQSRITGFSRDKDRLFVHRHSRDNTASVCVCTNDDSDENHIKYPVLNVIKGDSGIKNTFFTVCDTPLFVTKNGVSCLRYSTAQNDNIIERVSYFADKKLSGFDKNKTTVCVWRDYYLVTCGSEILLFDTNQRSETGLSGGDKYAYECFLWKLSDNINRIFCENDSIGFVSDNNEIFLFDDGWTDNGKKYGCRWTTKLYTGTADIHSVTVNSKTENDYECRVTINSDRGVCQSDIIREKNRFFQFSHLDFSHFTFSSGQREKSARLVTHIKNTDYVTVKTESETDGSFTLYSVTAEYTERQK